jgi:hypothetical protein
MSLFLNFFPIDLSSARSEKDGQVSFFWKTPGRGCTDDFTLTVNSSKGWVYFECYEKREMTTWLFTKTEKEFETKCILYLMGGCEVGEETISWELSKEDEVTLEHLLSTY